MNLEHLFDLAVEQKASDLHLMDGEIPRLRIAGSLLPIEAERANVDQLLGPHLSADIMARIKAGKPHPKTLVRGDLAFHGICYRAGDGGISATFRIIAKAVPSLDRVGEGAQELFEKVVNLPRGLVLVVGPTGSGKTTTIFSLVERMNERLAARIFVISEPAFIFESKKSLVTHLYVGQDCENYERGLDMVMKADLDVVALDDIPNLETLRQIMNLVSTGHVVIANLHATSAAEGIDRLIESAGFEGQALRRALAENLFVATAQRLLPGIEKGRAPAYEWIYNSDTVRAAILGGGDLVAAQLADPESRTLTQALDALVAGGRVTEESTAVHRLG